ncbi:MAG: tetratricopeptide repeat protein [Phycisphaerales bacterium]|nr:tetratricopeptide repeat protein [Phycisphaerales bacterium]
MTRILAVFGVLVATLSVGTGCHSPARGPYLPQSDAARNPLEAQRLTQEALRAMEQDEARAERLLREALTADVFFGPAHNDLGVLLLGRGDLAGAASEFEFARRLLPGLPDPRLNLAMTLERAGRVDEAIGEYRSALEVYPEHMPSLEAMTRCQLRHGRASRQDSEVLSNLREIALQGESEAWRGWAAQLLAVDAGGLGSGLRGQSPGEECAAGGPPRGRARGFEGFSLDMLGEPAVRG